MTIDMCQEIKNFDGTKLLGPDGIRSSAAITRLASLKADITVEALQRELAQVSEPLTLRVACCEALMGIYKDEADVSGQEKTRRYFLAQKCWKEPNPDLMAEDISLIKALIAKRYYASVVGCAWGMLEGK